MAYQELFRVGVVFGEAYLVVRSKPAQLVCGLEPMVSLLGLYPLRGCRSSFVSSPLVSFCSGKYAIQVAWSTCPNGCAMHGHTSTVALGVVDDCCLLCQPNDNETA